MAGRAGLGFALVGLSSVGFGQGEAEQKEPPERPPDVPTHGVEIYLSDESFGLDYRYHFLHGKGFLGLGVVGNDDDDFALNALVLRQGSPTGIDAVNVGVGIGAYAAFIDDPNADVYALPLAGSADYTFATGYPVRLAVALAYAPDVTTFDDGDELLDLLLRAEVDVSAWSTAFVGYRRLEVELDDGSDEDVDQRFHVGIRLGF